MILYHGSNTVIDRIDLEKCRPYKDFGKGFYLTDLRHQAERMAARTAKMFRGVPTLTTLTPPLGGSVSLWGGLEASEAQPTLTSAS